MQYAAYYVKVKLVNILINLTNLPVNVSTRQPVNLFTNYANAFK